MLQETKQEQESGSQTAQEEPEQGGTKEKIAFWLSRCEEGATREGKQGLGVSEVTTRFLVEETFHKTASQQSWSVVEICLD